MNVFLYHPQILKAFPNLAGGVILARNLQNSAARPQLRDVFRDAQHAALARIGDTPLSEIAPLAAWRGAFRAFGVNPTKYRSAPEALLRRLTKKGDIPGINALVDICNMISIRYALPVAAFDTRALQGPITVHFALGNERYTPLGREETVHPVPGEVVFSDETGLVIARRWCWRQSAGGAAREDTTAAVITVEAVHEGGRAAVDSAMKDILELLKDHLGGEYQSDILDSQNPSISGR